MLPDLCDELKKIIKLKISDLIIVSNRESNTLEFKESFNFGSLPKYAKTMAAFSNNTGGYMVFGVKDSPHELIGLDPNKFSQIDPSKITTYLNSCFSPELVWEIGIVECFGKTIGFIYTFEAEEKPIIALKNDGSDIKESAVYYRYRGQTSFIKYPELEKIIQYRLDRERKAWIQHLENISKSGPTKVAILDTIQGKIFGANAPFIIDEKLLRQLKVVRSGSFSETKCDPVLRLIGELQTVSGVSIEKSIPTGIHFDDLTTAFLAQRELDKDTAKSYFSECAHQTTYILPIFYFLKISKMPIQEGVQLLSSVRSNFKNTIYNLCKRLNGTININSIGTVSPYMVNKNITRKQLIELIAQKNTSQEQRSIIYGYLKSNPNAIKGIIEEISIPRLLEAITNLNSEEIISRKMVIFEILLNIFNFKFQNLKSAEKSVFRKCVAYVDECLYRNQANY